MDQAKTHVYFMPGLATGPKTFKKLKLNKDKQIENLSFEGEGCAISLASASILTETVKGKDLSFIKKISEDFINMINEVCKKFITLASARKKRNDNHYHIN